MDNTTKPTPDAQQLKLLQEAFATFNSATAELQQSYDKLKRQVQELNLELEETNKKLKRNLKEKEALQEYLQNILENAPNGVAVINNKGCLKNFNKAAEQITGYKFEEIKGANIKEIIPQAHQQKIPPTPLFQRGERSKIFIDSGDIKCKNGDEKTVNIYISKLQDRQKRKIGSVIAFEDVTNLKRLKEQIQRKNRLEAMGEMAAGISHEIRNPLGAIELFASLLKRDVKGDEPKEELAENIIAGVKSLTNITSNLLLFTKNIKPKLELLDISKVIDDALIFTIYATQQKKIMIEKEVDKKLKEFQADAELLKQVLLNLVLNAVQAVKSAGVIRINARKVRKESLASSSERMEFVQITVEDTGHGIAKENLDKVFNPFFTTKRSGLGLGLAIVHKIITSMDGTIEVSSTEGVGTKFTILLPMGKEYEP